MMSASFEPGLDLLSYSRKGVDLSQQGLMVNTVKALSMSALSTYLVLPRVDEEIASIASLPQWPDKKRIVWFEARFPFRCSKAILAKACFARCLIYIGIPSGLPPSYLALMVSTPDV